MTVLITGGAGYIGTHTCVELLQNGYDIVVVDNFSNSNPEALQRVKEITGKSFLIYTTDVGNKDAVRTIFQENKIHAVLHFAGFKAVGESILHPIKYYLNNMVETIHLCEVMQEYGVKKMVFSSSATVYGEDVEMPLTETMPLRAMNPYGRTKQMVETFLEDLQVADSDWGIAILRYFNPIGAHESGRLGEDPSGVPNNLVPFIAQVAIGKRDYLSIYGNDYPTKDGTGIRDYIHVVDLAIGHVRALEKVQTSPGVDRFNLGTGMGYSVLDMVEAFTHASRRQIPYQIVARRKGDIAVCYANPTKAHQELSWRAERGMEAMCRDTWRWQSQNPNGYQDERLIAARNKLYRNEANPPLEQVDFL